MTYIELLNSFWSTKRCSSNETAMYLLLLHLCNVQRWSNPFECKTRDLELMLGLTRATIAVVRRKLKEQELIDFRDGKGKSASLYLIAKAKVTNEEFAQCFSQNFGGENAGSCLIDEQLTKQLGGENAGSCLIDEQLTKQLGGDTLFNKDIKDYNKKSTYVLQKDAQFFPSEIPFPKDKKKASAKSKIPQEDLERVPTLETVKKYFLIVDADKRLTNWEDVATQFYDYFAAVDWKDRYNRNIKRWDSRANNWIADEEKRQKQEKQHEDYETDKFSRRRGFEPGDKERKGFKGTFLP